MHQYQETLVYFSSIVHEHHQKNLSLLAPVSFGEMLIHRDVIIVLTSSKSLFVLLSDNEERIIFPGIDAIVGANSLISLSLMSLGSKLHWCSIEKGLVCQPGTCFLPQLMFNGCL